MVKYASTYTKGRLKKRSEKDLSNYAYAMFSCFFLYIKAYVIVTHLNCLELQSEDHKFDGLCAYVQ